MVEEARTVLAKILVVPVVEPAIGLAPPLHYFVTEPGGKAIVSWSVGEHAEGSIKNLHLPQAHAMNNTSRCEILFR